MMRFVAYPIFICLLSVTLCAESPKRSQSTADQWQQLIDKNDVDHATVLCQSWVGSPDIEKQVEAQKCLANVALAKGKHLSLQGNEVGGGTLGTGYSPDAIDEALKYLNEGIRLAPQDVSIHEGRLHILEVAGRFDDMIHALDESATIYRGKDAPDIWLAYTAELSNDGEPTVALHFCEVLNKHYPDNSDILGNLGAFHNMLNQWDQGMPYERRAVELNPNDPIDTWNLGWSLDHLNLNEEADRWMSKSTELGGDWRLHERKCLYGQFLVTKLKKPDTGCRLVQANCVGDDLSVCKQK